MRLVTVTPIKPKPGDFFTIESIPIDSAILYGAVNMAGMGIADIKEGEIEAFKLPYLSDGYDYMSVVFVRENEPGYVVTGQVFKNMDEAKAWCIKWNAHHQISPQEATAIYESSVRASMRPKPEGDDEILIGVRFKGKYDAADREVIEMLADDLGLDYELE